MPYDPGLAGDGAVEGDYTLERYINLAIDFVGTLPPK